MKWRPRLTNHHYDYDLHRQGVAFLAMLVEAQTGNERRIGHNRVILGKVYSRPPSKSPQTAIANPEPQLYILAKCRTCADPPRGRHFFNGLKRHRLEESRGTPSRSRMTGNARNGSARPADDYGHGIRLTAKGLLL